MFDYYNSYDLVNMSDGRRPVKNHVGEQDGEGLGSIFASIFGKITKAGVSSAVKATAQQAVKTAVDTAKELPNAIKKGAALAVFKRAKVCFYLFYAWLSLYRT